MQHGRSLNETKLLGSINQICTVVKPPKPPAELEKSREPAKNCTSPPAPRATSPGGRGGKRNRRLRRPTFKQVVLVSRATEGERSEAEVEHHTLVLFELPGDAGEA